MPHAYMYCDTNMNHGRITARTHARIYLREPVEEHGEEAPVQRHARRVRVLEQPERALPVLALEAEPRLQRQDPPVGPG